MRRNKCLLVGNGLNRCSSNGIEWGNLLKVVADEFNEEIPQCISFPLQFEYLANSIQQKMNVPYKDVYTLLKQKLVTQIKINTTRPNCLHYSVASMPFDAILTSNYDLMLEEAFEPDYKGPKISADKYTKVATDTIGQTKFFHIHGIESKPSTICLGYEHYAGVLQNLREDINRKSGNPKCMEIIRKLNCAEEITQWGEWFYDADMYIVGLGLYDCEIDLWWLLTHRASLYYSNYENIGRKIITNKIIYYDILENNAQGKSNKLDLLKKLNVEVRKKEKGFQTYMELYEKILNEIREEL